MVGTEATGGGGDSSYLTALGRTGYSSAIQKEYSQRIFANSSPAGLKRAKCKRGKTRRVLDPRYKGRDSEGNMLLTLKKRCCCIFADRLCRREKKIRIHDSEAEGRSWTTETQGNI